MPNGKYFIFFCLTLLLSSCKKENAFDCFKSNGTEISETRNPGSFSAIRLDSKINLEIRQGAEYTLEVKAGKHVIKNISTRIVSDTLVIDNNNKCNFVRGYKKEVSIIITVPHIRYILNNGVGTIRFSDSYSQDSLMVKTESSGDIYINGSYNQVRTISSGNGDVHLTGSTNTLLVFTTGTNYVWANGMTVKDYAFIETMSLGDCYVNATGLQRFDYKIYKTGKIFYSGNPPEINNLSEDAAHTAVKTE